MRLVATVSRRAGGRDLQVPAYTRLDEALADFPDAVVAVALPPHEARAAALWLARTSHAAVVQGPIAPMDPGDVDPSVGERIQVAHGWVTLPGCVWLERLAAGHPTRTAQLVVEGLPEEDGGDVREVLWHGLALARRLHPEAQPREASWTDGSTLTVRLARADEAAFFELRAIGRGHGLSLSASFDAFDVNLTWRPDEERRTVTSREGASESRLHRVPSGERRALGQVVDTERFGGDTLSDAVDVARLFAETTRLLGGSLPPTRRSLRHSERLQAAAPDDPLTPLGLRGELPQGGVAHRMDRSALAVHLDESAFAAGLKPALLLDVPPSEEAKVRARHPGAHVERRVHRAAIDGQDAWTPDPSGEERVELFLGRDAVLARRAAALHERDPTVAVREMGELMGYPACCIAAFADQADRGNNTLNRYETAARTIASDAWPWELNNLVVMLAPFFPCRYDCAEAVAWVRRALDATERHAPGTTARLRSALARPVLYHGGDRAIAFAGAWSAPRLEYTRVEVSPAAPDAHLLFAAAVALGNELTLGPNALVIARAGTPVLRLERTDPMLGFTAPFGSLEE